MVLGSAAGSGAPSGGVSIASGTGTAGSSGAVTIGSGSSAVNADAAVTAPTLATWNSVRETPQAMVAAVLSESQRETARAARAAQAEALGLSGSRWPCARRRHIDQVEHVSYTVHDKAQRACIVQIHGYARTF